MRIRYSRIGIACLMVFPVACQLVTVPVKTAGGIVETSIQTTGNVVEAPFRAVGGRNEEQKEAGGKNMPKKEGRE